RTRCNAARADLHWRVTSVVHLPRTLLALTLTFLTVSAAGPRDVLSRAKQLYNSADYDAALDAASAAAKSPELCDAAQLVIARAYLERFRQQGNEDDKAAARDALKQVRAAS